MRPHKFGALLLSATTIVDRAFRLFDAARSAVVATCASDRVLEAFNARAYGGSVAYDPRSLAFRSELFNWEADALTRLFPPPPARLLVGGAGGGREALALAARGYATVAFDPSVPLVRALASMAGPERRVSAFVGRYEGLPLVAASDETAVDLSVGDGFDAALFGWASYSHLRGAARRVAALRKVAALTRGPILVSFFPAPPASPPAGIRRWAARAHLWSPHDRFTPVVGYYHLSTREEVLREVEEAGLAVLEFSDDASDGRWPYCVVRRSDGRGAG
jgi:hypothetical protein